MAMIPVDVDEKGKVIGPKTNNAPNAPNAPNVPLPQGANTSNYYWGDPNVLFTDQGIPSDKGYLQREPYLLADRFKQIEQEGVYGRGGVRGIMNQASVASAFRRKKLKAGLMRGRLGRQLGPRSGAINNLIANKVWAPELGRQAEIETNLLRENLLSKTSIGTQGLMDILEYIQNRYNERRRVDEEGKGGLLDLVGPGADIATLIFGGGSKSDEDWLKEQQNRASLEPYVPSSPFGPRPAASEAGWPTL